MVISIFLFTETAYPLPGVSKLRVPLQFSSKEIEPEFSERHPLLDFINDIDFRGVVERDTKGRLFGRFVALFLLPLAACVMLILAPFVTIGSPGPVFFRHETMGHRGEAIVILKLRTFTNERDVASRHITLFGDVIRCTGLDEVPQIVSIILGDMQWFGPRPGAKKEISNGYTSTVLSRTRPGIFSRGPLRRHFLSTIARLKRSSI
ncbi:MAG: sugar transferase [Candidatus Omnitrophota bacterium]|nr:sugar transferase [Candidatus Omnitrophota bacterium]